LRSLSGNSPLNTASPADSGRAHHLHQHRRHQLARLAAHGQVLDQHPTIPHIVDSDSARALEKFQVALDLHVETWRE
jgi:hypothetical protein